MDEEILIMEPVEAFTSMFFTHLERADNNLIINNFVLLRNVCKQALKDSHLDHGDLELIRPVEELWGTLNRGCSCTKSERTKRAVEAITQFALSSEGKGVLRKVKQGYNLQSLKIDIPEPEIKFDV